MCSFSDLPVEVQSVVLTAWLKVNELVRLDTAMCNRSSRSDFLRVLETQCILETNIPMSNIGAAHRWCILRSIRCRFLHARTTDLKLYIDSNQEQAVKEERARDLHRFTNMIRTSNIAVRTLHLVYFDAQILQPILAHCTQLASLHLEECRVDASLWQIIHNNKNLTELCLSDCRGERSMLYGAGMSSGLAGSNILKLLLSGSLVHDQAFIKIASHTPHLRALDVSAAQFSNAALVKVSELCRRVTHLSLCNHSLDDATFVQVVNNLACIRAITVTHTTITDLSLQALAAAHGRSIVAMELNIGARLTMQQAVSFLDSCTALRSLALHYLPPFFMALMIRTADLTRLTSLNVGTDWDNGVLRAVAESCPQLQLFGCRFSNQPHTIMSELRLIARKCAHLQAFYLGFTLGDGDFNGLEADSPKLWRIDEDFPQFNIMNMPV